VLDPDRHLEQETDELRSELVEIVRRHVLSQKPGDIDIDAAAHAAFQTVYPFDRLRTASDTEALAYIEQLVERFDSGQRETGAGLDS
jgi:hypothetical protein